MESDRLVTRQKERAEQKQSQLRADMKKLMAMPEGRRVFWELLGDCQIFRESMETSGKVYIYQGMRNIGLLMLSRIQDADEEAFYRMMREARQREQDAIAEDLAIQMDEQDE